MLMLVLYPQAVGTPSFYLMWETEKKSGGSFNPLHWKDIGVDVRTLPSLADVVGAEEASRTDSTLTTELACCASDHLREYARLVSADTPDDEAAVDVLTSIGIYLGPKAKQYNLRW